MDTSYIPALPPVRMEDFEALAARSETVISRLRERVYAEGARKSLDLRFNVRTAAEMVGRSEKLLRDAEADGRLPEAKKDPVTARRQGYTLAEVNHMRAVLGTLPHRAAEERALVLAVQSNLGLYDAEYEFAARMARDSSFVLDRLREGIDSIRDQFDIILMDPPPALGMISLSVLRAADALLVPAPPNNIDFGSTAHFLRMMAATLEELSRAGGARDYAFLKILVTKMSDAKSAHQAIHRMMQTVFPEHLLQAVLKDSAEIDNATAALRTVYEVTGPAARTATHRRCRAYLDAVGREVEILVRKTWPSHFEDLRKEGLL